MDKKVYEFISQQTSDPIAERKTCAVSGKEFAVFQSDLDFYSKISPKFDGQRFQIPTPTLCPEERMRRRIAYNQETVLYSRTCDFSGKKIISGYSPDKPFKVYDSAMYWTDQWDPTSFGIQIDGNKSFFTQFSELQQKVPRISLLTDVINQNSPYVNQANGIKNCYMIRRAVNDEDCYYSYRIINSQKSIDCSFVDQVEFCYQAIESSKSYNCIYIQKSIECTNSAFLYDCMNCHNCFMCWNLRGKSYCIENKQYTKEQYEAIIAKYSLGSQKNIDIFLQKYHNHIKHSAIHESLHQTQDTNSLGNAVTNVKDCFACFNAGNLEECKYSYMVFDCKKCMDIAYRGTNCEFIYESATVGEKSYNCKFCTDAWNIQDCYYCDTCMNCKNCFGCIGLNQKEYCIFNKQYNKEEYEKNVAALITKMTHDKERGEFFPIILSPLCYNESPAQTYFPLNKEIALAKGYKWMDSDYAVNLPENANSIQAQDLPDNINDISDDVVNKIIICAQTGKPFRIIKQELDRYRKVQIPLPRIHPNARNDARIARIDPWNFSLRNCDKTGELMLSVHPTSSNKKVYSVKAYHEAVYG